MVDVVKHMLARPLVRYALAVAVVVLAALLRQGIDTWTGGTLPTYITFYPAVMLVAILAGVGPGLLATLFSALWVAYWVIEPRDSFAIPHLVDQIGMALFSLVGIFMSLGAESLRRSWRRTAAYERERIIRQGEQAVAKIREQAEEELRRMVAELERSNRDLEQFAYVASHDLQEPLRQVKGFAQLLSDRYGPSLDEKATEYLRFIADGTARMSSLVSDLLSYSRVGAQERKRTAVDMNGAIEGAMANLQAAVADANATVTHDDLPRVTGDSTQMSQLFQNLVGNAIKFRRDGVPPRIHVAAQADGHECTFRVSDNGIGIDPAHFDRVFLIFQRLHGRGQFPGTGIGLAICKKIVEQHGGRIWVESSPGQGSTFCFSLPKDGVG
ncbi:MAG: ATP-binding protein [Phycisphaerae bacterium]|nr:ATP-binding protein [Phycisphaerae bacterium]